MNGDSSIESVLQRVLQSFKHYYDVTTDGVSAPFVAEAVFHSHNEQYFLVRAAHIADIDSNEYVFFATEASLTEERLLALDAAAWQAGISRVTPHSGHRNSDVTLVVLAEHIAEAAFLRVKKLRHYKSYRCSLYGWSHFRALAYEASTGKTATNRLGTDLQKLVRSL